MLPSTKKRKVKDTTYDAINELSLKWLLDALERRLEVNGPMLQKQALRFANELGITSFSASNGWKDAFLKRNNIKFGKLCGERGDVDNDVVGEWKERLPSIVAGYANRDIYNLDETGLLFKTSQSKTFYQKDKKCAGGKKSKERLTLMLCANLCGEKEKAVIVGKSARPRAFMSKDVKTFPCLYKFSKKAWMTTPIFTAWLTAFNEKMVKENRNVLLFLDNAPCHPNLSMSNVKLQFFPPNTTTHLQPLDQGVIQAFKLKFRSQQMDHILLKMEAGKCDACHHMGCPGMGRGKRVYS